MRNALPFWFLVLTFLGTVAVAVHPFLSHQSAPSQPTYMEPEDDFDEFVGRVKTILVEIEEHEFTSHFMDFGSRYQRKKHQTSQFSRDGKKLEEFYYRSDGVPLPKTTYTYDNRGQLLKALHFSAVSGKPYLENRYTYDSQGKVKEVVHESLEDHKVLSRKIYTHDEKKRYTEFVEFDSSNKLRDKIGIFWNNQGRPGEIVVISPRCNGQCKGKISYDAKGRQVESTVEGLPGVTKENYRYEDDEHGNWIKKSLYHWVTEDGKSFYKLMHITHRTLTYY